jgi:hypothetical protein
MNSKIIFPLLVAMLVLAGVAADKPASSGVIHLEHEQVASVFAHGGPLLATNNFKVLV